MPSIVDHRLKVRESLTWIEIDEAALIHNLEHIKMLTLPSAEVLAVIKANAYGHGLLEVAKVLKDHVTYFGVASIDEALRLRQHEIESPILLFGIHPVSHVEMAISANVTLTISSLDQAGLISSVAEKLQKPAVAHIKIDTGMGRLGISLREAKDTILKIAADPRLKLEGIYTHFPSAEADDHSFTEKQIRQFHQLIAALAEKGVACAYRHTANSAGILNHRSSHLNLVRPGLALYGIYPHPSLEPRVKLKPALHWKTKIILTKTLHKGDSVGYGQTFVASGKTNIAILPIGYSHGYPVALSGKSKVLIQGKFYPVIGRVSMDYIAIELGDDSYASGELVTLLGSSQNQVIHAEELATLSGTIPYEIVTRINPQIPRILA